MLSLSVAEVAARVAGVRQRVVAVMRQREINRSPRPELRDARQIGADREAVLDTGHDR